MMKMNILNKLAETCHKQAKDKGFWDDFCITSLPENDELYNLIKRLFISEKLLLAITELAESHEARRKNKYSTNYNESLKGLHEWDQHSFDGRTVFEEDIKDTFEDEIADTLIRIFDLAGALDIDLDFHVREKLKYNSTREHKHGKTC